MRILLLNQFFWPDSAATSQLLTDLARDLVNQQHEVHVICSASCYASASEESAPAVSLHRVKATRFVRGRLGRILSYASFYIRAAQLSLFIPKPDVVLTLTTPPLLSLIGNVLQGLRGSKHWIWEMDLYPDVAVDLGYMKARGVAATTVGALADWSRRRASGVIALGECMKDRLTSRGIPASHIEICNNWADSASILASRPLESTDQLQILYSGNLGLAHDLDTLTAAIKVLDGSGRFHFHFVGGGGRRDELAAFVQREGITSIEMLPYVKRNELSSSLSWGDIGLVTQRDQCCGSIVPSKVYGLMAAGRPILFIGPAAATPACIIRRFKCGWHVACGDVDKLTQLLMHLSDHRDEVLQAGIQGRQALLENFDLHLGTSRIASLLLRDLSSGPATDPSWCVENTKGERALISNS